MKRVAKLQKRKIGLALGSGAARGLAHIGVLEVLEKEGIPVDMIAGSSMGALIGALYAQGKTVSELKDLAIELGPRRFFFLSDLTIPRAGLIQGRRIKNALKSIIGDKEFRDLKIPFACVATDIETGEEVVINQGSVLEGIKASTSIPIMFTVAKWKNKYLVDGALVDPVPVSVVRDMGADFIIAVNVAPDMNMKAYQHSKEPNIFNVIMQTIHIASHRVAEYSLSGADIVIEPQVTHIASMDFHRGQECILQGETATQASIPEIKRKLRI